MKKSSSIAIFLVVILFLAPFAEAETIQIINYIPRISGRGRKGQQHDRGQSLDKINNLMDNLKEVINSEFGKGSAGTKRAQERSSECESQQKSQRMSTQSSLKTEKKIETKETKLETEDIQASKDTKIVEEKIQDVPKESHSDNSGAQKIETTQLATNEPSVETKKMVHQAQKPTVQIKKQESTIEVKQDNKEEADQKGSIIIQSSQNNVPKTQPLEQQQAQNHQVEVQQAKSAEILPQKTTIPQETSLTTASSIQVVESSVQKNEKQVQSTTSTAVEAEPENVNLIKTHQQPAEVVPEKNQSEQVKVIPLPVQQSTPQIPVQSTDSSKKVPDIQSYLTKAEPVTTLQIQIQDKKVTPDTASATDVPLLPEVLPNTSEDHVETQRSEEQSQSKKNEEEPLNVTFSAEEHQQQPQSDPISLSFLQKQEEQRVGDLPSAEHSESSPVQSENNVTTLSEEKNDKLEFSASTEPIETDKQQKEQEKEVTPSVMSSAEGATPQVQANLTVTSEHQLSLLSTDSVQNQISNNTQPASSSNSYIAAGSNHTESSQAQNQTQIVQSEKIQQKQVVSEPIAQIQPTPVNTITSHAQVEPQIAEPITTLPVTPVKNIDNDQLLQEKEVVTEPAKEPSPSFMASICMPMCDYESSAPVCEHQRCRACQTDLECVEQLSIFEAHPSNFKITCDVPSGRCIKKEQEQ